VLCASAASGGAAENVWGSASIISSSAQQFASDTMQAFVAETCPVLTAAQSGSLMDSLKAGGNPDEVHILYGRVLHWAIVTGKLEAAKLLLAAGAEINAPGKHGRSPLHFACIRGDADAAQLLVDAGADLDATCHLTEGIGGEPPADGPRPIEVAAKAGHDSIVRLLEGVSTSKEDRRKKWEIAASSASNHFELHFLRKKRAAGQLRSAHESKAMKPLLEAAAPAEKKSDGCCLS